MGAALAGKPEKISPQPNGIVTVRIDPETGARAQPGDPDAIFEIFRAEHAPTTQETPSANGSESAEESLPGELF